MKRIWIGIALLGVLLIGGVGAGEFMEQAHDPVARDVQRAGELALEGQWELAQALVKRGQDRWEEKWPVTAAIADHEPMDEIDALFAQLETYGKTRDSAAYSAVCGHLGSLLEALSQGHRCKWWNLM